MKKVLLLSFIAGAFITSSANAQSGPAPSQPQAKQQPPAQAPTTEQMAAWLKEAKEKQVPMLVEKAGITAAQAEKVIEINFEIRSQAATTLAGLNDADRSAKIAEMKITKEKRYSEILTPDQIKAVYAAYESMGREVKKN